MFGSRCLLKNIKTGQVFCVSSSQSEVDEYLDGSTLWLVGSVPSDSPFLPQPLNDVVKEKGIAVKTQQHAFRAIVNQCRHAIPVIAKFAQFGVKAFVANVERSKSRVMINAESCVPFSFSGEDAYDLGDRFALSVYVPICKE